MNSDFTLVFDEDMVDAEIWSILTEVYVNGGFTELSDANVLFKPSNVRARGKILGVRDRKSNKLAGIVILVSPDSTACRLAKNNEAEIQLLAVHNQFRRQGLGQFLVQSSIGLAKDIGYSKIVLWTQSTMHDAQNLYASQGFLAVEQFKKNDRLFIVYNLLVT